MKIDPIASFYLSIVYNGEIALKQSNLDVLHDWADKSLSDIYEVFNKTQESAKLNLIPSFSETISDSMRILPGDPNKKRKTKKIKKDYSLEFLEILTKSLGAKMNSEKDGFVLPENSPTYAEALSGIKLLMQRAHSLQMVPKGLWLIGVLISLILFSLSGFLLFYRALTTEFVLLGSTALLFVYCFFKWKGYPSFPEVAEYIKDLTYKRSSFVDDGEKLGKIRTNG